MPERTEYPEGVPSWIDLATTDTAAAQQFYGELFGWQYEENETDVPDNPYIMASQGGKNVAGMMTQSPEQAAMGIPCCWNSYVTVDDIEASVGKVGDAGGQVMMPPMDVMDAGRMAVVVDPTGGVLALWQAKEHIGAQLVNEHGSLIWNELMTNDVAQAANFYNQVVGWDTEAMDMGDGTMYTVFNSGGDGIAGAMPPPMEGMPTFWGVYFAVDDCDGCVAKASEMGGTVLVPAMDGPPGRFAALQDPQGASFSVMQPAEMG